MNRIIVSIVTLSASVAFAGPPQPPPELDQLSFFPGSYLCTGRSTPPGMPAYPVVADVPISRELGGFFFSTRYAERKTRENPMPLTVVEQFTWDPAAQVFVRKAVDSMGGWSTMTSPPPADGKSWSYSGDYHVMGQTMPARIAFTALNPKGDLKVVFSAAGEGGRFSPLVDLDCRKQ